MCGGVGQRVLEIQDSSSSNQAEKHSWKIVMRTTLQRPEYALTEKGDVSSLSISSLGVNGIDPLEDDTEEGDFE